MITVRYIFSANKGTFGKIARLPSLAFSSLNARSKGECLLHGSPISIAIVFHGCGKIASAIYPRIRKSPGADLEAFSYPETGGGGKGQWSWPKSFLPRL